jgi:hypothetical protein
MLLITVGMLLGDTIKDELNEQRMVGNRKPYSTVVGKPEVADGLHCVSLILLLQHGGNHGRFTA